MIKALALLLLLTGPGHLSAAPPSRELEAVVNDTDLERALSSLYDLEYERTRRHVDRFIRRNPDNPFGYLFSAGTLWWQVTTEYDGPSEVPIIAERFEERVKAGLKKAKKLRKAKDKARRPDGYFAAGMLLGIRGQWKLANRQWIKAYRDGKKAIKHLRKCVKLNPDYYDAYLGLGIFDYQTAKLPGVLRIGAKLLLRGVGDADRGLSRIRLAIEKGRFAARQGSSFLLTLYMVYEKDYGRALELTSSLRRDFPASPYYMGAEVILLDRAGEGEDSRRRALELFSLVAGDPARYWSKQRAIICNVYGTDCLDRKHVAGAARWLTDALASPVPEAPAEWTGLLHLYRGIARDILMRHGHALRDYEAALAQPDFIRTHEWAAHCSRKACDRADALRLLGGKRPR